MEGPLEGVEKGAISNILCMFELLMRTYSLIARALGRGSRLMYVCDTRPLL